MANISPVLNELLKSHDAHSLSGSWSQANILDDFLKEAYIITAQISSLLQYLRSVRQSYLSTSLPPRHAHYSRIESSTSLRQDHRDRIYFTDKQRDEIDADSKQWLQELNAAIQNLSCAEQIHQRTEDAKFQKKYGHRGLGVLGKWAAGGSTQEKSEEEMIEESKLRINNAHRESVLWYLQRKLEECAEVQRNMVETRLTREIEKNKSILYKGQGISPSTISNVDNVSGTGRPQTTMPTSTYSPSQTVQMEENEERSIEKQLDPEQLQLLAKENQDMLKYYEDTLDKVRTAEQSLLEISELQSTLANNLTMQSAQIDQLVMDSFNISENVGKGNVQLKKSSERRSTAKFVFYASCGLSLFLITWDLIF